MIRCHSRVIGGQLTVEALAVRNPQLTVCFGRKLGGDNPFSQQLSRNFALDAPTEIPRIDLAVRAT
jgi:hypothetical protein